MKWGILGVSVLFWLGGCLGKSEPVYWMGHLGEVGVASLYAQSPAGEVGLRYACLTPPDLVHSFGSSYPCPSCDFTFSETAFYSHGIEYNPPAGIKVFIVDYDHSIIPIELTATELAAMNYPEITKLTETELWRSKLKPIIVKCQDRREEERQTQKAAK